MIGDYGVEAAPAVAYRLENANGEVGEVLRFGRALDALLEARRELGAPHHVGRKVAAPEVRQVHLVLVPRRGERHGTPAPYLLTHFVRAVIASA